MSDTTEIERRLERAEVQLQRTRTVVKVVNNGGGLLACVLVVWAVVISDALGAAAAGLWAGHWLGGWPRKKKTRKPPKEAG